jgi:hypothetical protein
VPENLAYLDRPYGVEWLCGPGEASETRIRVKGHPCLLSDVSLRRPTASKAARMTYSAVHNLSRHVT